MLGRKSGEAAFRATVVTWSGVVTANDGERGHRGSARVSIQIQRGGEEWCEWGGGVS